MSPARTPGLTACDSGFLGFQDSPVDPRHLGIGVSQGDRSGQVDAVSAVDPAKVQHHQVPIPHHALAGVGVREGGIGTARDDRFERAPLETGRFLMRQSILAANSCSFRPARDLANNLDRDNREQLPAFAQHFNLVRVFHDAQLLDHAIGRHERSTPVIVQAPGEIASRD